MKNKGSMAKDTFLMLPAKVLEGILLMFVTALYSAIFSTDAVAVFRYVNTTVLFSYLVGCSFMSNSATRYVQEEFAKDKGKRLISTIFTIYLAISITVGIICMIIYYTTSNIIFILGFLMFATYTLFQILNSMLIQLGKIRSSIILSLLSASLKLIVAYVLVAGQTSGYPSAVPAVTANIVADFVALTGAIFVLKVPSLFRLKSFSKDFFKVILAFGIPLVGVSVNVGILNVVDTYLVGFFHGLDAVAIYGQNYSIASSIFTMINIAVMRGVYPNVLRHYKDGGVDEALPHLNIGVRLYMLIAFPCALGLSAISLSLSKMMFVVEEYHKGAPVIALTAIAMVFYGLTEYANKAYELTTNTKPVFQNSLISAIIKVLMSALLLSMFSYIFSAVGTLIAFITYFLITANRAKRIFLFSVKPKRVANILISAVLCGIVAKLTTMLPLPNLVGMILAIGTGGITYVLSLTLLGEIKDEIAYFKKLLLKK